MRGSTVIDFRLITLSSTVLVTSLSYEYTAGFSKFQNVPHRLENTRPWIALELYEY